MKSFSGKKKISHQIGSLYLLHDEAVGKLAVILADCISAVGDNIRLETNDFAYTFEQAHFQLQEDQ